MQMPGNSGLLWPDSLRALHDLLKTKTIPGLSRWSQASLATDTLFSSRPFELESPDLFLAFRVSSGCLPSARPLADTQSESNFQLHLFNGKTNCAIEADVPVFCTAIKKGLTGSSSDQAFDP